VKHPGREPEDATLATLEQEVGLIGDAIALVASGGAPRVFLAGLSFGEQLLEPARRMAEGTGARIVPTFTADESGVTLTVERAIDG
jgi:hypothetical protein